MAAQLDALLPAQGEGEIAFYGGSFTLLPVAEQLEWLRLGAFFVTQGRAAGIRLSTRPDAVDAEVAVRLAAYHVICVELGCQSFDKEVLWRSARGHGPEAAAFAVAALRNRGLHVGIHLMPGLPGGNAAEAYASLGAALELRPDFLRIHPTVVLRGTPLEQLVLSGAYHPWSLENAVEVCAGMVKACRTAGMPLVRLGLQGTEALNGVDTVVAGPYHPAFGQLVRSRIWLEALLASAGESVRHWQVHPSDFSDALGHRRCNLDELRRRFGDVTIKPAPNVARETFVGSNRVYPVFT